MQPYPTHSMHSVASPIRYPVSEPIWFSYQTPQVHPYYQANVFSPPLLQGMLPYPMPYPKPHPTMGPAKPGIQSILGQYKTPEGSFDINKMMNTMGQVVNAVNQVSSLVKGLSQTFKL